MGAGKPSFGLQGGVRLGEGVQASLPHPPTPHHPRRDNRLGRTLTLPHPMRRLWGERRKLALDPQPLGTPVFWNLVLSTSYKGGGQSHS